MQVLMSILFVLVAYFVLVRTIFVVRIHECHHAHNIIEDKDTISQPKKEEDTINNVITHKEDKNDVHRHRSN